MQSKAFFVILLFMMLLVMFAGASIGESDLTPNGPSNLTGGPAQPYSYLPKISSDGSQGSGGYCGATHRVSSGETLSRIALNCGVSLEALLAANPTLYNPHKISVGQQINMPYAAPLPAPTATAMPPAAVPTPAAIQVPTTGGLHPGAWLGVKGLNLQAKSGYQIGCVPENSELAALSEASSNDDGTLETRVQIPMAAKAGEKWVVVVWIKDQPETKAITEPFVIEQ